MPRLSETQRRGLVRELANNPDGVSITCAGHSMTPTIRLGDRVRVRAGGTVQSGDVVLFEASRGCHVLHRVVFTVPGTPWFLHIGDAGSGDGPGIARRDAIVGIANVPRRRPSMAAYRAGARRVLRGARRYYQRKTSLPNV